MDTRIKEKGINEELMDEKFNMFMEIVDERFLISMAMVSFVMLLISLFGVKENKNKLS